MKDGSNTKGLPINMPRAKHRKSDKPALELKQELSPFGGFANSSPIGLYIIQSGKFQYVNPMFEEIIGYHKDELIGTDSLNYVYHEDRDMVRLNAIRMLKGESNSGLHSYDYRIICKSGKCKWITETVAPFKYKGKRATLGNFMDITDRKQTEDELRKFKTISAKASYGIIIVDREGHISYVNTSFAGMHGYTPDELTGKPVSILHTEQQMANVHRLREKIDREGSCIAEEVWHKRKDGIEFPTLVNGTLIKDENEAPLFIASTAIDITERKRAEEVLQLERDFSKNVIDTAQVIILILDKEGHIADFNPYMEALSGYCLDEVHGQDWFNTFLPENIRTRVRTLFKQAIGGIQTKGYITPIITRDGRELDIEWYDNPLKDVDGTVTGLLAIGQDVTERKKVEEALQESEQRFRKIFEIPLTVMLLIEPQSGRIVDANTAASEYYGYPYEVLIKMNINEINQLPPDAVMMARQTAAEKRRNIFVFPHRLASGEVRTVEVYSSPITVNSQVLLFSIIHDITERKKVEQALQESEQRLREAQALGKIANYEVDLKNEDVLWSEEMYELFERDRSLPPPTIEEISSYFSPEEFLKYMELKDTAITEGKEVHRDIVAKLPSGNTPVFYVSTRPVKDDKGQIVKTFGIIQDITERKKTEEAIKSSEEKFNKAFHASPTLMAITTFDDGRIVEINPAYCRALGYEREECVGHTTKELKIWADLEQRRRIISEIKEKGYVHNFEVNLKTKSGQIITVIDSMDTITLNNATYLLSISMDVTGRMYAEKMAEESREELHTLYQRLQNLREEERTQIAGELHDELGQAMTALKMDLSWLAKRLPSGNVALLGKIAAMSELTDTTAETIRRISTELRPGLLDDLGLAAAIEWQTGEFARRSGIKCSCTSSLPDINIDKDRSTAVFRIFQELLTNISRHANASKVTVNLSEIDGKIELKVADNGTGISEEAIASKKSLGLIGIRERANAFGGEVIFTGSLWKGTIVTVQIPLKE